jgi:hypothetical protein
MRFKAAFLALILAAGPAAAQGWQYLSQNVPTAPAHNLQGYPKPYGGAAYSDTPARPPAEEVRQDVLNSPENIAILRGGTAAQGAIQGYHR